jgi:chromosome segregation ATPase
MTKVFVVLTAVLSIVASVLFISATAQWADYKQLSETYQTQRQAAQTERDRIAVAMATALAMKDDTLRTQDETITDQRAQLQSITSEKTELQERLVRAQNAESEAEAGRTKLQEVLDVVTSELRSLQKRTEELLAQNINYQTRIEALNSRVLELTAETTILTEQNRNLQARLVAYERQLAQMERAGGQAADEDQQQGVPSVSGPIRGEITGISDQYASINIGSSSGVVNEMTMMVYRGNQFLGELIISQVNPETAAGRLQLVQGDIRAGDRVAYEGS